MFTAFFYGTRRATRSIKLMLSLFLFNLLFALPLIIPVFAMVQLSTANRLTARHLLADQLDPVWMTDLINNQLPHGSLISFATETFIALYVVAGLYLLFNVLLSGGVLAHYLNHQSSGQPTGQSTGQSTGQPSGQTTDERFSLRLFWANCGAYVWRFIRLMLYSFIFYGMVFLVYGMARRGLSARLTQATALGHHPWYRLALFGALLLGLAWVNMVFDYARLDTVINEQRAMWRAMLAGWRFSLRHGLTAYPLYLSLAGLGFCLLLTLTWLRDTVIQNSMFAVGLATAFGHAAIVAKLWAKLALAAGQAQFYQAREPAFTAATVVQPAEMAFEFRAATSETLDPAVLARAEAAYAETPVTAPTTAKLPALGKSA